MIYIFHVSDMKLQPGSLSLGLCDARSSRQTLRLFFRAMRNTGSFLAVNFRDGVGKRSRLDGVQLAVLVVLHHEPLVSTTLYEFTRLEAPAIGPMRL